MMEKQKAITDAVKARFEQEIVFLQQLVQTKSSNAFLPGTSSPDAPVEKEVAAVIQRELLQLGFEPELVGVSSQRPNVLCHSHGSGPSKKTLILTTHMDTVQPSGFTRDPWGAQVEDRKRYGVGAADAKAQIAAFTYATQALRDAGIDLDGQVTLAFVVDEETGASSSFGTHYLLEQGLLHGDAAIVGEPGNSIVAVGHRGLYRFRLQIQGEATHTGIRAWEQGRQGHNAILDMARLAQALAEHPLPVTSSQAFPGRKSVLTFPTLIQGGSGISIVPGSCEAYGDVRLLPGLSGDDIKALIQDQLQRLSIHHYQLTDLIMVLAVETDPQAEIEHVLAKVIETITGIHLPLEGSGPACDGWMFITRGIPTICGYGVTCGGVHGADEWVDLQSLQTATEIYAHTILRYLSSEQPLS